jgi:GNAT superfamily N-acetyltransferase
MEQMDTIRLREAEPPDAAALGALHVAAWREAYAGILPPSLLDSLSADRSAAMWRAVLDDPSGYGDAALFVAESEGAMVGFGACFAQRDEALAARGIDGEIGAVYVLQAHQGAGIGRALMRLMALRLLDQGRQAASLWVLRANAPARRFYEALGGTPAGEKTITEAGATYDEVAYAWPDITALLRR